MIIVVTALLESCCYLANRQIKILSYILTFQIRVLWFCFYLILKLIYANGNMNLQEASNKDVRKFLLHVLSDVDSR